jgi:hypothetical protein
MINSKAIRFITLIAFINIAIKILLFYFNINSNQTVDYLQYPLNILSIVTYVAILIYLLNILNFFKEKNSVILAFKIYIGFEVIFFIFNRVFILLLHSYSYSDIMSVIHCIVIVYLATRIFDLQNPAIKLPFVFFVLALLVIAIIRMTMPVFLTFLMNIKSFPYFTLVDIIPIIAAITILNKVPDALKYAEETPQKAPFISPDKENPTEI